MSIWAIVLADGHGSEVQKHIEEWFQDPCPKQFCTFCGTRSMLAHTLHRTARIVDPERILTILSKDQRCFLADNLPGRCLEQPEQRGSAVGAFLAITEILAEDHDATALIVPADHLVLPEDRFIEKLDETIRLANIHRTYEISKFYDGPSRRETVEWWRSGHYWNTMIVTARLKGLWELGWQLVPSVVYRFNQYLYILFAIQDGAIGADEKELFLSLVYEDIPSTDLSSQILARATDHSLFCGLKDLYWSDWDRPERILETIERFGLKPNFQAGIPE
ncbi:MAG: hypothetical protein P8020_22215, partial [Acidobacteriota bacterium]